MRFGSCKAAPITDDVVVFVSDRQMHRLALVPLLGDLLYCPPVVVPEPLQCSAMAHVLNRGAAPLW